MAATAMAVSPVSCPSSKAQKKMVEAASAATAIAPADREYRAEAAPYAKARAPANCAVTKMARSAGT